MSENPDFVSGEYQVPKTLQNVQSQQTEASSDYISMIESPDNNLMASYYNIEQAFISTNDKANITLDTIKSGVLEINQQERRFGPITANVSEKLIEMAEIAQKLSLISDLLSRAREEYLKENVLVKNRTGILLPFKKPVIKTKTAMDLVEQESQAVDGLFAKKDKKDFQKFFMGHDDMDAVASWYYHYSGKSSNEATTLRYEIQLQQPDRVMKYGHGVGVEGALVHGQELQNLESAITSYYYIAHSDVYKRHPASIDDLLSDKKAA